MIDIETLSAMNLFKGLAKEHLDGLLQNVRPLHIDEGENLVTEGIDTHAPLFIVTDGRLRISRQDGDGKNHEIAVVEGPTVVGELEFLTDQECSATVTALDTVRGVLLPRSRFDHLLSESDPAAFHLALSIGRLVSQRLALTNALLIKALSKNPERAAKVQNAQFSEDGLSRIDAELEALLG